MTRWLLSLFFIGASLRAQEATWPPGLRAGKHDAGVRVVAAKGQTSVSVWYPARCGRRAAVPIPPCRDAAADSGRFPVVLLSAKRPAAGNTALCAYLASHGFVVVTGSDTLAPVIRRLPFLDASRTARVDAGAPGDLLRLRAGHRSVRVAVPPGVGDHTRLRAAVAHAYLDAAFDRTPPRLVDLMRRLRAAGLVLLSGD